LGHDWGGLWPNCKKEVVHLAFPFVINGHRDSVNKFVKKEKKKKTYKVSNVNNGQALPSKKKKKKKKPTSTHLILYLYLFSFFMVGYTKQSITKYAPTAPHRLLTC
jgi:hypothetical protein